MAKAKKTTKKELSPAQKVEIGIGLTAAAVAAAGAYFLYGSKNAEQNRKTIKSWALKAKADVLEKLEDAKKMSREEFEEVVQTAAGAYAGAKTASKKDLKEFAAEMMEHWDALEQSVGKQKKSVTKKSKKAATAVKKVAKKVTKQTTKKTTKKAAKKTTQKS
jgi:hypothetical protein